MNAGRWHDARTRTPVRSLRGPDGLWEVALARPHPRLRPGVLSYRGFRLALGAPRQRLEVPIGAVTLMLGFGDRLRIRGLPGSTRPPVSLVSVVSGLTTRPVLGEHDGRIAGVEVLLTPWAAFTLFGTEQHELAERALDPDTLGVRPGRGRRDHVGDLAAALAALPRWSDRFGLLDDVLAHWSQDGPPCSARIVRAWDALTRTGGRASVARIAEEVGWSVRQLENRFREQIGVGPKAAGRILRLQRARRLLAAGRSQAETAALCGFYDQAHLSGEFKAMTGCTPRRFVLAGAVPLPAHSGPPSAERLAGEQTSLVLVPGSPGQRAVFASTGRRR
ncbi:helix-turn-helix domain-containing protein [Streptomyces flavofungini]|uniref:AraC family transcriptional regulator n=1 Tax=Streptomyces flavofungini TaxID=68200 RepID=A0ABS0XJ63_9ACTN|nr:helix-turn-helix domain-containing protein [Streptomyces flavofungini]MBJ3812986.1 AraC family transcriptional regulator [Streptomyces flavofungini]GHC43303.1 AraC family transcriptional regulator [Streptomyces flavofungini]